MIDLETEYKELIKKYDIEEVMAPQSVTKAIRDMINRFMNANQRVALYCYGEHTKMLMSEFAFELKNIICIIDNHMDCSKKSGYKIIRETEIEDERIDGVIISTYQFRDSIKKSMRNNHPMISILDFYEEFERQGIFLKYSYYKLDHPFHNYNMINEKQNQLAKEKEQAKREILYWELISLYIHIKDFRTAICKAKELKKVSESAKVDELLDDLNRIYEGMLSVAESINEDSILMLCIDSLRRQDFTERHMPKLFKAISDRGVIFDNAYSYSTSTYESLLPAYSNNSDMRTHYYDDDTIEGDKCPFIRKANEQGRYIRFDTDMCELINDDKIKHVGMSHTITQKFWQFLIEACSEPGGFFYIHNHFESHFSFANPYTKGKLVAGGQSILFDFLDKQGGKLRTNYIEQHGDAVRYLDDVIAPIISRISCKMIMYSDHGIGLIPDGTDLKNVPEQFFVAHEDLIRIPMAIIGNGIKNEKNSDIISLMDINSMVISLLENETYETKQSEWIKIGRNKIYNPEMHFIYKMRDIPYDLLAFEGFVFSEEKVKLLIFSDGRKELYSTVNDEKLEDDDKIESLFERIRDNVSVSFMK